MKFLVIGNGAIGKKRIDALIKLGCSNIFVYDNILSEDIFEYTVVITNELGFNKIQMISADNDIFKNSPPDWVFIATSHSAATEWAKVALQWGSKVLVEKPLGRNYQETQDICSYIKYPNQLFVGFNYRFYKGVRFLCRDIEENKFGNIISINVVIGHAGSPEDKHSWKLNSFDGSSDSLLDPGIHVLDILNSLFPNKIKPLGGKYWSGFWDTGVKEEVHMLYTAGDSIINFSSSIAKWRNTFSIEVNGTDGYGCLNGRGGNYGIQSYVRGKRWGWNKTESQRESERLVSESDCSDSFLVETESLLKGSKLNCTATEALATMKLYDESIRILQ